MRPALWAILAVVLLTSAVPCLAISRFTDDNRFYRRSMLSGYAGGGYPVGEFESSRLGDGNHQNTPMDWEAPDELNWGADLEHFFERRTSVGMSVGNVTYQDKSDPLLETHVSTFGGFLRYVLAPGGHLHPFLRFGVGGQRIQFQDPDARYRSNTAWSVQGGGGLMLTMFSRLLFTGQAVYNLGFTENTYIPEADARVGFDTKFWSIQAGVGILFP